MSSVLDRRAIPWLRDSPWTVWIPIAIGLGALYIPTYVSLWKTVWQEDEQGHGPLILAVIAYLVWQKRSALIEGIPRPNGLLGWPLLILGLLVYVVGRSQDILMFEVGSHIVVLSATLLLVRGTSTLRAFWFPLLFFVFMVPLPGIVVDALTSPLKRHVSVIAEHVLYSVGYPIARSGVTLTIGPYQLLVADACSGLHSLYSLTALGLLYLYLMQHKSLMRNALIGAAILPIAFGANILRVIFLVLVTYHLGDEAGQGFLHGFAGLVLFVAALGFLFLLDGALGIVAGGRTKREQLS
ncbi:MAG: exosortase B [Burkholderiales bacterium]|nr:exosortase B [Burkholderiales bacterium]